MSNVDENDKVNLDRICCSLSKTHFKHLLKSPYLLQCRHSACKECIIRNLAVGGSKCNNTKCEDFGSSKESSLTFDTHQLDSDVEAEAYFQNNSKTVFQMLKDNFIKFFRDFENTDFLTNIDKQCEFVEDEIDIRIESLKEQLENLRLSMHEKLNLIKEEVKGYVQIEEIESKKQECRKFVEESEYSNGFNLITYETQLLKYMEEIEKITMTAPKIEFELSNVDIDEMIIGNLQSATRYKYEQMVNSKVNVTLPHKFMNRIAFLDSKKLFLITDREDKSIKVLDLDGNYLGEYNPGSIFEYPFAICVDHKNEILVGDYRKQRIFVFSSDFTYLSEFGDNIIKNPNSMVTDKTSSTIKLYVSDFWHNEVTVWNAEDHSFIACFDAESPAYIKTTENAIFVVSALDLSLCENTNKIDAITKGMNCIFVYDKTTFATLRMIKIGNWIDPYGLHIDKNQNILITASLVDDDQCLSESSYLFKIDEKGNLLHTLELKKYIPIDFYVYENKILFISFDKTPIHIDEFN